MQSVTAIAVPTVAEHAVICADLVCVEFVLETKYLPEKCRVLKNFHGKNMSRSSKKGPYIDEKLLKKILKQKETGDRSPIKTWARASQISPDFVGHRFAIHNGKKFIEVLISETMVGYRLGELSPTRTFRSHGKVTKKILSAT